MSLPKKRLKPKAQELQRNVRKGPASSVPGPYENRFVAIPSSKSKYVQIPNLKPKFLIIQVWNYIFFRKSFFKQIILENLPFFSTLCISFCNCWCLSLVVILVGCLGNMKTFLLFLLDKLLFAALLFWASRRCTWGWGVARTRDTFLPPSPGAT